MTRQTPIPSLHAAGVTLLAQHMIYYAGIDYEKAVKDFAASPCLSTARRLQQITREMKNSTLFDLASEVAHFETDSFMRRIRGKEHLCDLDIDQWIRGEEQTRQTFSRTREK